MNLKWIAQRRKKGGCIYVSNLPNLLRLREGYEFFKSNGATPQRSRGGDVHGTSSRGVIGFISVKGNQKV